MTRVSLRKVSNLDRHIRRKVGSPDRHGSRMGSKGGKVD